MRFGWEKRRTPAHFSSSPSVLNPCVVSDGCCISGLLYGDRGVNNAVSSAAGDHSSSSSDHEEEDEEDEEAGLLSPFHSSTHLPFSLSCSFIPQSQICLFPSLHRPSLFKMINTHEYTHFLLSLTDLYISFLQVIHLKSTIHINVHMFIVCLFILLF